MSDSVSRFEGIIDRINIVYGLVVPVGLMTLAAALLWIFTPEYFQPQSFWIWLGVISSVGVIFGVHYKHVGQLSRHHVKLMYFFYHSALMVFTIKVAPFMSPFDFLWVILAIGMDLLFGRRWLSLTFGLYLVSLGFSAYLNSIDYTALITLETVTQIAGAVGTTLLVSKFRELSDEERTALDHTSHNIAFERQRLLSLINNMGEAVIAMDHTGKIVLYNAAVLSLFDTNVSLEKQSIGKLLNLYDKSHKHINVINKLKEIQTSFTSTDYMHKFADNDFIKLYINISSVKLGFGRHDSSGFIAIIRDITKEKSLEEERDEFISVISHELRTPVAIAEGNIGNAMFFAEKHKSNKETKEALAQAHDKVVFLSDMINDLSTLSRAERTDYKMEITDIKLNDFINQLEQDYESQAATKGLTLRSTCSENLGVATTSELYLREVLQNFITNAIKYTKKGTVIIHARTSNDNIIFSVADSGIGLSKSDQKRIFEKFWRSEDYRTRESSGTGLGLYVTLKLARKLGGNISLESELNRGTTITLSIPRQIKIDKTQPQD